MPIFKNLFSNLSSLPFPRFKTGGASSGVIYKIPRLLGSTSVLSLIAGTNANLTLTGTDQISATNPIANGEKQIAVIRETLGSQALEYPVTFTGVTAVSTGAIVGIGDSILAGTYTSGRNALGLLGYGPEITVTNLGVSGQTLSTNYNRVSSGAIDGLKSANGPSVLFIQGGINDLSAGTSASALYTILTNLVALAKSKGFKTIAQTIMPRRIGSGWTQASDDIRVAYNALIAANSAGADYVLDLRNDAKFGEAADYPGTTSGGTVDGLHPQNASQTAWAPLIKAKTDLALAQTQAPTVYGAARLGNNLVSPNYYGALRVFTNMLMQSNWGKNPSWNTQNALADTDKSGNLYRMSANTDYRKICGRPSRDGGNMVIDWSQSTGDTTCSGVYAYSENGATKVSITNFAVLSGQKKAVFTWSPPPGEEQNLWGFHIQFISPSGNGTCIQPFCAEGDLQGNFVTREEFYSKYIDKWKIYSVIRDLDMSVANGGGSHAAHGWADRTPSDNLYPASAFLDASVTLGGIKITAKKTAGQPYYAAVRTKVRLMEKMGTFFGAPRPPIQTYAHKILIGVNAPSGTGSHSISGPDANGDITLTVTPPSTATTWTDLKNYLSTFSPSQDLWLAAIGDATIASGFTGSEALSVVAPIRMSGGTDPINADAQPMELKVRLMNKITAARNGDPCHFHWVAQAGVSADFVDGFCRHFKANAAPGCKLLLEISNEPWNTAPFFVDGNLHLAAVGISTQSFGPSNVGKDLRAPVDDSEKGYLSTGFVYGLAHKQRTLFALAKSILGNQLVRASNGVFHQGGPNVSNFNLAFNTLGIAEFTDIYLTADYDYSPMGEPQFSRTIGNQGQWATGKSYKSISYSGLSTALLDYFTDGATNKLYFATKNHTSTTIAADLAAGNIAEATPTNLRDIAIYGQTQTVDNAVRFSDALLPYTNDNGVSPLWAAYEGGATGFDIVFYDDPVKGTSSTWNGTADERTAHYNLIANFLTGYFQSSVKREVENIHASERMRRLRGAQNSYYTEYAGQGGNPYPNSNHCYQMMRDLEASDDINQRWAGARDAQLGKFYGYFIETILQIPPEVAKPSIRGNFAVNQVMTAVPFTPYNYVSTGYAWYDGPGSNANKLQEGGLTYTIGSTLPPALYIKQYMTDNFGRRIDIVSTPAAPLVKPGPGLLVSDDTGAGNTTAQNGTPTSGWSNTSFTYSPATSTVATRSLIGPDSVTSDASTIRLNSTSATSGYAAVECATTGVPGAVLLEGSVWLRGKVGGEKLQILIMNATHGGKGTSLITLTTEWTKYTVRGTPDSTTKAILQIGQNPNMVQDALFDAAWANLKVV